MSTTPIEPTRMLAEGCTSRRRVRHEARDAVAVMAFSAIASSGLAVLLTLVVRVGG